MSKRLFFIISFLLVSSLILTSNAGAGLVGWWKLDDGAGTVATDSAGDYDGTLIGNAAWVDGMLGGALSFDGDGDYVDCGNDPIFNPSGSFGITLWAYIADWGTGWAHSIIGKGGDQDRGGWSIRRYEDETLCFTTAGVAGVGIVAEQNDWTNMNGNAVPPLDEWVHIACVYDVNNMTYIYFNGEVDKERAATGTVAPTDGNLYIGTRGNSAGDGPDDWASSYFTGMLDDVRFYDHAITQADIKLIMEGGHAIPQTLASRPIPADSAADIPRDAILSWRSGELALAHDVYFGTNFDDVNQAGPADPRGVLVGQNQVDTTYDPPGLLDYNQTYYWRVDEVNDTNPESPWRGNVWSFTAANFLVVEDFEDYNDYAPNEIWNTWIDGYGVPTNGATSGYPDPDFNAGEHFMETSIVHSGAQSMPIFYDNGAGLSEVTKTLTDGRDWTREGVVTLMLFYYGDAANAAEQMYVALNGNAVVNNPDANAALVTEWTPLSIPLQDFAGKGVNLANVSSISIGFGNKANPVAGGSGHVFVDDIRLYRP